MSLLCTREFSLSVISSTCPELCDASTKDWKTCSPEIVISWMGHMTAATSDDNCFVLVITSNASYTECYFNQYDPVANTLTRRATMAGEISGYGTVAFDANKGLFVTVISGKIVTFDPSNYALDSFSPSIDVTFVHGPWVYIPEKLKIYGQIARNGSARGIIGYIDLDARDVVQVALLNLVPSGTEYAYAVCYSPVSDSLYCCIGVTAAGIYKVNLTSGAVTQYLAGSTTYGICWDSDRELMVVLEWEQIQEFNTGTDALSGTYPRSNPNYRARRGAIYSSEAGAVLFSGEDGGAYYALMRYDTTTHVWSVVHTGDVEYYATSEMCDPVIMVQADNLAGTQTGIRLIKAT